MKTILGLHHLVASSSSVDYLEERHELTLFTDEQYTSAFAAAGLQAETVEGPIPDRDRYVATKLD